MTSDLVSRRLIQVGALFLIGHGLMGLIKPRWHSLPWRGGPQLLLAATDELADHPKTARAIFLAQAVAGLALVASECECCGRED
ncbi:MAG: hypothetical protein ABI883_03295 [Chthoniobacterales bacterium]